LWHESQFEGRRVRPPVFLARRPDEPVDRDLAVWYRSLVFAVGASAMKEYRWQLLNANGWPDNQTARNLMAWSWSEDTGTRRHLVVVNLSDAPAQGMVPLGWSDLSGRAWKLVDLLDGTIFDRHGDELSSSGLYVDLQPWRFHLLTMSGS
jgi:hypothetical protein